MHGRYPARGASGGLQRGPASAAPPPPPAHRLELRRVEVVRRPRQLVVVDIRVDIHLARMDLQGTGTRSPGRCGACRRASRQCQRAAPQKRSATLRPASSAQQGRGSQQPADWRRRGAGRTAGAGWARHAGAGAAPTCKILARASSLGWGNSILRSSRPASARPGGRHVSGDSEPGRMQAGSAWSHW